MESRHSWHGHGPGRTALPTHIHPLSSECGTHKPDSGLGFLVKLIETFWVVPTSGLGFLVKVVIFFRWLPHPEAKSRRYPRGRAGIRRGSPERGQNGVHVLRIAPAIPTLLHSHTLNPTPLNPTPFPRSHWRRRGEYAPTPQRGEARGICASVHSPVYVRALVLALPFFIWAHQLDEPGLFPPQSRTNLYREQELSI